VSTPVIGFAGMTHLGIVSAAAALARGFGVVGFDEDETLVSRLQGGEPPVLEVGLPELLQKHAASATFTARIEDLSRCDLVYISTDVPTDDTGASELGLIRKLIQSVGRVLGKKAVVAVLCQVPPGFTRGLGLPKERLYCQVETLVFGRAVERALRPERIIVGCADPELPLPAVLRDFLAAFECPVLPMGYESAELAKIAINCCLVSSISTANTLAELCEQTGAVWSDIVPALRLDARIGKHSYLAPGLGIAGGNLERDLATVIALAAQSGTDAGVVQAWLANSRHRRDWALRRIRQTVLRKNPGAVVAVWGLAYKENTRSVKNSPSLATIRQMPEVSLRLYDPVVPASVANHPKAAAASDAMDAAMGADALMILTPWPQFKTIALGKLRQAMRGRVVVDPYAVLDRGGALEAGLEIHTLGRPPLGSANSS
jgi:UDPglucose 6-dehydrogenase